MATLGQLEVGDRFYNVKDKKKIVYTVFGKREFNLKHGSATRQCVLNGQIISKSCRIEVVKLGLQHHINNKNISK